LSSTLQCKSICVLDTCSLLYSAQIQLKNKELFEWLLNRYQVYICSEVKYECFDKIQKGRVEVEDPERLKCEISRLMYNANVQECLNYLDHYCSRKNFLKFFSVQEGERRSFALALFLSLNLREPVVVLTDDFGALDAFNEILAEQKFAVAEMLPDFMINLFQTTENIEERIIHNALRSYYSIATRPDLRRTIFDERIELICRSLWTTNCGARCFS